MKNRTVPLAFGLASIGASLVVALGLPETARVNLGEAYPIVKGSGFAGLFLGCLSCAIFAHRWKPASWSGLGLIAASLLISGLLQKSTGGSMGTAGWTSAFVSILFVIPLGIVLCAISAIASLSDLLSNNSPPVLPLVVSIAIPLAMLSFVWFMAGKKPEMAGLVETLQAPGQPHEYFMAASKLSEIDDPNLAARLIPLLHDQNAHVRGAAAMALGGRSRSLVAVEPLVRALETESNPEARSWMIRSLGVTAAQANVSRKALAVDILIELLKKPDVETKQAAAESLGFLKAKRAIGALVEAMGNEQVRFHAHNALIAIVGKNLGDTQEAWRDLSF